LGIIHPKFLLEQLTYGEFEEWFKYHLKHHSYTEYVELYGGDGDVMSAEEQFHFLEELNAKRKAARDGS